MIMPEHHTRWMLDNMREEAANLERKLYKTPQWRKIKRYGLFERILKLQQDADLIEHVLLDDDV